MVFVFHFILSYRQLLIAITSQKKWLLLFDNFFCYGLVAAMLEHLRLHSYAGIIEIHIFIRKSYIFIKQYYYMVSSLTLPLLHNLVKGIN